MLSARSPFGAKEGNFGENSKFHENLEKSSISIKIHGKQLIFMKIYLNHLFSLNSALFPPLAAKACKPNGILGHFMMKTAKSAKFL